MGSDHAPVVLHLSKKKYCDISKVIDESSASGASRKKKKVSDDNHEKKWKSNHQGAV